MGDISDPRLREILAQAASVPSAQRPAMLDTACAGDAELRRQLESLLAALDRGSDFLENPTLSFAGDASHAALALCEGLGSRIGHYRLLQKIGEGGMGIVFMAEQQTPVVRKVALKIIKPGMDSRQVIARFEAERQALAVMDHANIAHVYDAGATESGRPYFVMELVRGTPITEYCDQHELTTRQRLELLVQVCQAVQHAHSKGIIHRDLKPSNVLVTIADGRPVPKVIDFGVSKAIQGRLTEKTLFTEFRQLIGTPQYMSPEQADSNGVDVDTRSDVYSLGVLLYELLTGTTPLDGSELRSKAYAEMERMIRESEPPAPSTRLSTLGDAANAVASRRKTEVRKLGQLLRGELDWIVLRALEKDRARRYETANSLARDLERYLADEPVDACPPSPIYRLRKLVRRHKSQAIVISAVAASLILGVIGTSLGLARAKLNLGIAQAAENRERNAKDVATGNEIKAREAETREKTARLEAQKESYFSKVALGNFYAENGSLAQATQELLECASYPDKNWEWGRLALLCNHTPLIVSCPEAQKAEVSRDGHLLLVKEKGGAIRVYELGRHESLWRALIDDVGEKQLYARFNSDGKYVVSMREGRLQVLDSRTGGLLRKIDTLDGDIVSWSTATNPRWLFCFMQSATPFHVFDLDTGGLVFQLPRKMEGKGFMNWGRDWGRDRVLAWYGDKGTGSVWDVATGTELCTATIPIPDESKTIRVDFDNLRMLYRTAQGTLKVWDLRTSKELPWLNHDGIAQADFLAGGLILTLSDDHNVCLWESETGRLLIRRAGANGLFAHPSSGKFVIDLANKSSEIWSPQGRVASLNATFQGQAMESSGFDNAGHFITVSLNGTVTIWNFEPGRELMTHGSGEIAIARSADGTLIATGGSDHRVKLWEARSGRLLANLDGHWKGISSLAFSNDGELLASAGEDGLLKVWEVQGRRERLSIRAERSAIHGIAFDSGRRLATASGAAVKIWDADSGRRIQELIADERETSAVVFSRDGSLLAAAANDGIITIWDASGRRVRSLVGHLGETLGVSFSADAKRLVSGGEDSTARVWDVASGKLLQKLSAPGMVTSVAFSPDGKRIAATADGAVQLWDADSGRALISLSPPPGVLFTTAVFSQEGSTLAAGGSDGKVRQWETFPWRHAYASSDSAPLDARLREYADGYWKDRVTAESTANVQAAADAPPDLPRSLWPRRDPEAPQELVDLTNYYNAPLNVQWRDAVSDLLELPLGVQALGGVRFDVRGVIQLAGAQQKAGEMYPHHVDGIRVDLRAQRLHLLHAAAVAAADGEQVGSCVLHYADGSASELPIRFGREVDLVNAPTNPPTQVVQAWVAGDKHLYLGTWENPSPDKVITSIDLKSQGAAAPLVVAVSVELPKADLEARVEELKPKVGGWSALIRRARALVQLDRLDEAAADYRKALAARPSDEPTRRELVELLLATNQTDQATRQLGPDPDHPPDLWQSQWYVLSPVLDQMIASVPLIPEVNSNLHEPQSIGGKALRWRPTGRYTPVLNLRNWVTPQDYVTAYVQKRIFSQRDRQAVLTTFMDDGGIIWLNGEPIEQRFIFERSASRLPMRLRAGWNTLCARVFNGKNDYAIETTLSLDMAALSLPYQVWGLNGEGSCFSVDSLEGHPEQAEALETRAIRYYRVNRYAEAAADLDHCLRINPDDWSVWRTDSALHLLRGDLDGYRRARHEMIQRFGDIPHSLICRKIAEVCLLRPENDADQSKAIEMATRPLALAEARENEFTSQIIQGVGKLRAGQAHEAAQLMGKFFDAELTDYGKCYRGLWLAMALKQSGREAEGVRAAIKAIGIIQKIQDPASGESEGIGAYLSFFVTRQEVENLFGKQALADARAKQFQEDMQKQIDRKTATLASTLRATDGQWWADRGALYARAGLFREAADDFARVEIPPANNNYWHDSLAVMVELGDMEKFHRHLKQELERFKATTEGSTAHRAAKDAFIIPLEGDELSMAVASADRALSLPSAERSWACQTKGMAEYRRGHYKAALPWLAEASVRGPAGSSRVEDLLFTAMCCERLGDHKQAQLALQSAVQTMVTTFPHPRQADYTGFADYIFCEIVRREAEALINGPAIRPAASTQPVAAN